jgi:hypothetical protein
MTDAHNPREYRDREETIVESSRALSAFWMKGKGEEKVRKFLGFLGKYGILIIASCVVIYAILVKWPVIHTIDIENIFVGLFVLIIGELFRIESKLGKISGILEKKK